MPDTDSWATLRRAIEAWQTAPSRDSLLHGDFWPGNILWKGNHIAAVIDWEDASIGTAVADLATCRVELMMMYGPSAMENFTRQYLTHSTLDISDLPLWEVYASSAALATMSGWNLAPEDEAKRRQGTTLFLNRAASETINRMNH